jgi:2-polyprenyl-3-methyl-5-hydroxy-6-metoxy-1,4-benzoquinol methylase
MTTDLEFSEAVSGLAPIVLRAAATLRLADHIAAGHDTVPNLAAHIAADPELLARVLRFLTARGVFDETGQDTYALTPLSVILLDGHPSQLRAWLDETGIGARMDDATRGLLNAIRTGQPQYTELHGNSYYEDLAEYAQGPNFDTLRHTHAESYVTELLQAHPWNNNEHVVDVGGGTGALLEALMRAHPRLRTTLVDLPDAVSAAAARLHTAGYGSRFTPAPGSFFDSLPPGADVYTLVNVLHNWNDEQATTILRRCAESCRPGSTVIVVERLTDETDPRVITSMDLRMFLFLGGKERCLDEFKSIAATAGLDCFSSATTRAGLRLLCFRRKGD